MLLSLSLSRLHPFPCLCLFLSHPSLSVFFRLSKSFSFCMFSLSRFGSLSPALSLFTPILFVCMYICMYLCMRVCMYACAYVCMSVIMYVCMYVSMCLGMYVCMQRICVCMQFSFVSLCVSDRSLSPCLAYSLSLFLRPSLFMFSSLSHPSYSLYLLLFLLLLFLLLSFFVSHPPSLLNPPT